MTEEKEMTFAEEYAKACDDVTAEIVRTLKSVDPEQLKRLRDEIMKADQVFFVGVGRVMLALQCVCKRLAHLGIKAHYVGEITEPAIKKDDLLIVGSGSGGSLFPLGIAKKARQAVDCTIVHIGSNPNSEMKDIADFMVRLPVRTKFYLEDEIDKLRDEVDVGCIEAVRRARMEMLIIRNGAKRVADRQREEYEAEIEKLSDDCRRQIEAAREELEISKVRNRIAEGILLLLVVILASILCI